MEFNYLELFISFSGGIFGAAIGAFPIWVLCGIAVLIGAIINLLGGDPEFMNQIAWGNFLGPQTSFAGGTAAAAFAAKHKLLDNGKDICTALAGLNNSKVLFVGGIFGSLGYIILYLLMLIPNYNEFAWTNTIALAVILNMFVTRLVFGKTGLLGKVNKGENRWVPTSKASWIIYQSSPEQLILLGIAIGLPASYLAVTFPGSSGLIFGFVCISYIFMIMKYNVPVTHHIALSASMIASVTGSIPWGIAFGILAAFLGEMCAVLFVYHGDTHIDPPTMALVLTFTIFPILHEIGVFKYQGEWTWLIIIMIAVLGYLLLYELRKNRKNEKF